MKIALVITRFAPQRGGAESWTAGLAQTLLDAGHDVHVYARSCESADRRIHFHPVSPRGLTRARKLTSFCERAAEAVRDEAFDVVHDQGHGWFFNVFTSHDGSYEANLRRNLQSHEGRFSRSVRQATLGLQPRFRARRVIASRQFDPAAPREWIALSEMVRRDMLADYHLPPERVHLVYNGVDVERFRPDLRDEHRARERGRLIVADNETVFLFVGHNFRRKGLAPLIRATALLAEERQDFRVMVVGAGRDRAYKQLADHLHCGQHVRFVGSTPDVRPLYAAADAFVHPTYYDPCSLVVLEALACGLPVVTTRLNGAGELLTEDQDGFLVDVPDDTEQLAAHMEALLDADRRHAMGEAARRLAEDHPLERNHAEVLAVYAKAAERSPVAIQKSHQEDIEEKRRPMSNPMFSRVLQNAEGRQV